VCIFHCVYVCVCVCTYIYVYLFIYYIYIYTSYCVETVYELPLLPNNSAKSIFTQIGSGAKGLLNIYRWDAGLSGTEGAEDNGQNVLQSSFRTGSSSSPSYLQIFFLIAFFEEDFIRNIIIIIILCINCTILY
jgi:hypothetical protein